MTPSGSITRLVNGLVAARESETTLVPRLYEVLLGIARVQKARLPSGGTLSTSDVVHEAYLKMFHGRDARWQSRGHFFGSAARAMQQVLIDHWRREEIRRKHQPAMAASRAAGTVDIDPARIEEMLVLLDAYAGLEPSGAEIVRLRFFAGLSLREVAEVLDIPLRTAQRRYLVALGWLSMRMNGGLP